MVNESKVWGEWKYESWYMMCFSTLRPVSHFTIKQLPPYPSLKSLFQHVALELFKHWPSRKLHFVFDVSTVIFPFGSTIFSPMNLPIPRSLLWTRTGREAFLLTSFILWQGLLQWFVCCCPLLDYEPFKGKWFSHLHFSNIQFIS